MGKNMCLKLTSTGMLLIRKIFFPININLSKISKKDRILYLFLMCKIILPIGRPKSFKNHFSRFDLQRRVFSMMDKRKFISFNHPI